MEIYFTKQGYEKHNAIISKLEKKVRELQTQVQNTLEVGGNVWHDNASYEHLVEDIRIADRRVKEAYELRNKAKIINYPTLVDRVILGCEVTFLINNEEKRYKIVAYGEADITQCKILYTTPLAQVILGYKPGDIVYAKIDEEEREIEILDVKPLNNKKS